MLFRSDRFSRCRHGAATVLSALHAGADGNGGASPPQDPHGDSSIYDALVHMTEDYSLNLPLVDGHGNFGSIDGDSAAAMRYTEARLSAGALTLLENLDKGLVPFGPNFDESEKEPLVLPATLPNLLINGTTGIAVGMATNIPPQAHPLQAAGAAREAANSSAEMAQPREGPFS